MVTYRKKRGSNIWHWCRNCSSWPTKNYIPLNTDSFPYPGELCRQCKDKEKNGNCTIN